MPVRGTMQGGWSTYAIYDLAEPVHRGIAEREEEALALGVDGTLRPDEPGLDRHLPALGHPHLRGAAIDEERRGGVGDVSQLLAIDGALVDTGRQEHVPALIRPTVADYHSLRRVEA